MDTRLLTPRALQPGDVFIVEARGSDPDNSKPALIDPATMVTSGGIGGFDILSGGSAAPNSGSLVISGGSA